MIELTYGIHLGGLLEMEDREVIDSFFEITGIIPRKIEFDKLFKIHENQQEEPTEQTLSENNGDLNKFYRMVEENEEICSVINTPFLGKEQGTEIQVRDLHISHNHCMIIIGKRSIKNKKYLQIRDKLDQHIN